MSAEIVALVTPEQQQDELARRRRSLEAKKIALRRQFAVLEADEARARGEPLWNTVLGGNETTSEAVSRMTRLALSHLAEGSPVDAWLALGSATRHLKWALDCAAEEEQKAKERQKRRRARP